MKKSVVAIIAVLFIMFSGVAFAGTDKDNGTVCQGSTCNGGGTTPSVGNITATGGAGGNGGISNSSSNSSALGVGFGGNAVANGGNAVANGGSSSSNSVGIGGGANVTNNNKVDNKVSNVNANVNNNKVKNTNVNNVKNTNKQAQGQAQGQKQAQGQAQSVRNANAQAQNNNQSIAPVQNVITEAPRLAAPTVSAQEIPILQGGKIGDVTAAIPDFFGLTKLAQGEKIVKVLKVLNGSWFTKIRLEDVPEAILEGVPAGAKVRYSVWAKDGVTSVTTGGGIAASQSMGGQAATGAILPGWASSTANPAFVIFVYEVK